MHLPRKLPRFEFFSPRTIQEACSILSDYKEKTAVLGGGTNLVPQMKRRYRAPQYVVSLKAISDLKGIRNGSGIRIGAMTTIRDVAESPLIGHRFAALAQGAGSFTSLQIRNLATVGGNLCNGSPSADTAPAMIALGGRFKITGKEGERMISAEDFFASPFQTVLAKDEIMTEIQLPEPPPSSASVYLKYAFRGAMDHALVGVAVMLSLDNHICRQIRVALGACNPVPFRATQAEKVLQGNALIDGLIEEAAEKASEQANPKTDPEYKKEMIKVFTRRAIKKARDSFDASRA